MDIAWPLAAPLAAAMSGELAILFVARSVGSARFADDGDEDGVPQASALSARQIPGEARGDGARLLPSPDRSGPQLGFMQYEELRGIDFHALPSISRRYRGQAQQHF